MTDELVMESERETMDRELLDVRQLPPLSLTASRLLEAVADEDIELEALAAIISDDPGLTARIVGLANSAYFGQRQPIFTVEEAIIRVLGLSMVKSLALSISVAGVFQPQRCEGFDVQGYWCRALGTAQLARLLILRMPPSERPEVDGVYLCGLLHNLGLLLLAHQVPDRYASVLRDKLATPEVHLVEIERTQLGLDHLQAGSWLLRRWHLPDSVVDVAAHAADEVYQGDFAIYVTLVREASRWMNGLLDGHPAALSETGTLTTLPGLTTETLAAVESRFVQQYEELASLARMLN